MSDRSSPQHLLTFISYNSADRAAAREIGLFLTAGSINMWFDEWNVSAGDSIVQEINNGLASCTHFLIIWSTNSAKSNWVRQELAGALHAAISTRLPQIIPVTLDGTPLPP